MGNISPNLQMETLTFTEVNSPEVTDSKRKSQTRNLQSQLQSLCSKLGPGGHTNRVHGSAGGAGATCVQSTKSSLWRASGAGLRRPQALPGLPRSKGAGERQL